MFGFFKKKKRKGLCVLYLNCGSVPINCVEEFLATNKDFIFQHQGLDKFLVENNHESIIIPTFKDPTRMEFFWFD